MAELRPHKNQESVKLGLIFLLQVWNWGLNPYTDDDSELDTALKHGYLDKVLEEQMKKQKLNL